MNTNQYTQKTLEALQAAQQLAVEYQHNALEPEHLLHALASQEQVMNSQCCITDQSNCYFFFHHNLLH